MIENKTEQSPIPDMSDEVYARTRESFRLGLWAFFRNDIPRLVEQNRKYRELSGFDPKLPA